MARHRGSWLVAKTSFWISHSLSFFAKRALPKRWSVPRRSPTGGQRQKAGLKWLLCPLPIVSTISSCRRSSHPNLPLSLLPPSLTLISLALCRPRPSPRDVVLRVGPSASLLITRVIPLSPSRGPSPGPRILIVARLSLSRRPSRAIERRRDRRWSRRSLDDLVLPAAPFVERRRAVLRARPVVSRPSQRLRPHANVQSKGSPRCA